MGRMLEALRELERRQPAVAPTEGCEAPPAGDTELVVEPAIAENFLDEDAVPTADDTSESAPSFDTFSIYPPSRGVEPPSRRPAEPAAVAAPPRPIAQPIDPRYEQLAQAIVASLPAKRCGVLLLAGLDQQDIGAQLQPLAPALARCTDAGTIVVDCQHGCTALVDLSDKDKPVPVASWRKAVLASSEPRLDVLFAATSPDGPERFDRFCAVALVERLRRVYQLVVLVASPPSIDDIAAMAESCDGIYLVVRLGETSSRRARRAVGDLHSVGVTVLGTIVVED